MDLNKLPFNVRDNWCVLVGAEVEAALYADKVARVARSAFYADFFESESLCTWQSEMHARGYCAVVLTKSVLGWSVRYRSGLDGFGVLAGVRDGTLTGTFLDALAYARQWQNALSSKRFVVAHASEITDAEIETFNTLKHASTH